MEFTFGFAIYILIIQFCSFFVKGLVGFGDPLISSPMLSLTKLENSQITPMNLLMGWPLNLYITFKNRKSFSIKATIPMIVCILIGMFPGMFLLKYGSSWIIKAGLGVLILACGIEMLTRKESKVGSGNPVIMALVSTLSGFTAGLFGINLFFVAYIERTGYVNRNQFRGQMCFIFLVENTIRLISYIIGGFYTLDILKIALISAVGVIGGMFLGSRVDSKLKESTIRRIIIVVFMCAGLSTLIKALIFKI
jgi:uncharacterized membrane protein YfcA